FLDPCIPKEWKGFEIEYRYKTARYTIIVENPKGVCRGIVGWSLDTLDQKKLHSGGLVKINLNDDGTHHIVHVFLGVQSTIPSKVG
ncbi:MAG: hypothetical protein WCW40_12430, partial [Bacteroidota bacterium]